MSLPQSLDERASQRSTRQLLEELDALMERMLTLPVDEEPPSPAAPEPPPAAPIAVTLTLVEPLTDEDPALAPMSEEADRAMIPDEVLAPPVADPEEAAPAEAPSSAVGASDPVPASADENTAQASDSAPIASEPVAMSGSETEEELRVDEEYVEEEPAAPPPWPLVVPSKPFVRRRVSIVHRPYAWFLRRQQQFHRLSFRLGILGRLLRSEVGQGTLGILGLLLFAAAIVLVVREGIRWTW